MFLLFRFGLGNYYGILGGLIGVFSFVLRFGKEYKFLGKNFLINLGKRGIGFGYDFLLFFYNMFYLVYY